MMRDLPAASVLFRHHKIGDHKQVWLVILVEFCREWSHIIIMKYDFDLFTIGAGSGGVRASRLAAEFGANVAIAEESRVGGTCVIRGCVPKKLLVYASEFGHAFKDAAGYGWTAQSVQFNWQQLIANKDAEIDRLNKIYIGILERAGVTLYEQRAIIKDPHTIHLVDEGRDVTAEKILISVGGTPFIDENVPGHELGITSNEAFHLEQLPEHIVIAGGGYIAIEFAHIFAGLGSKVSLVYRGPTLLKNFDKDISARVHQELKNKGINLILETVFTKIEDKNGARLVHLSNRQVLEADVVFWAVGRRPKTSGLGLAAVGVEMQRSGAVIVDDWFQTSVDSIFAIGDVTDRVNLTPVAIREGVAFAQTQFNNKAQKMRYDNIPMAVFSQPPVGTVGMSEQEAREKVGNVDIYHTDFRPMKHILADNPERMMMKLIVDPCCDKVLGCHIVGDDAAEIIQSVAIAVNAGVTKHQFDATCALHPTAAEELVTLTKRDNL